MTLLERWDQYDWCSSYMPKKEIRRALAIAQAVEDYGKTFGRPLDMAWIMRRADELLEDKP